MNKQTKANAAAWRKLVEAEVRRKQLESPAMGRHRLAKFLGVSDVLVEGALREFGLAVIKRRVYTGPFTLLAMSLGVSDDLVEDALIALECELFELVMVQDAPWPLHDNR